MLMAFLAAAASQSGADVRPAVAAQRPATAVVRILRAAEIRRDRLDATEESVKRRSILREPDGSFRTATLIEFY
jgi:hypothetical protein